MGLDLDTNTEKLIALGALQTLNAFNSGRAQQAISDETKAASLEANRLTNSLSILGREQDTLFQKIDTTQNEIAEMTGVYKNFAPEYTSGNMKAVTDLTMDNVFNSYGEELSNIQLSIDEGEQSLEKLNEIRYKLLPAAESYFKGGADPTAGAMLGYYDRADYSPADFIDYVEQTTGHSFTSDLEISAYLEGLYARKSAGLDITNAQLNQALAQGRRAVTEEKTAAISLQNLEADQPGVAYDRASGLVDNIREMSVDMFYPNVVNSYSGGGGRVDAVRSKMLEQMETLDQMKTENATTPGAHSEADMTAVEVNINRLQARYDSDTRREAMGFLFADGAGFDQALNRYRIWEQSGKDERKNIKNAGAHIIEINGQEYNLDKRKQNTDLKEILESGFSELNWAGETVKKLNTGYLQVSGAKRNEDVNVFKFMEGVQDIYMHVVSLTPEGQPVGSSLSRQQWGAIQDLTGMAPQEFLKEAPYIGEMLHSQDLAFSSMIRSTTKQATDAAITPTFDKYKHYMYPDLDSDPSKTSELRGRDMYVDKEYDFVNTVFPGESEYEKGTPEKLPSLQQEFGDIFRTKSGGQQDNMHHNAILQIRHDFGDRYYANLIGQIPGYDPSLGPGDPNFLSQSKSLVQVHQQNLNPEDQLAEQQTTDPNPIPRTILNNDDIQSGQDLGFMTDEELLNDQTMTDSVFGSLDSLQDMAVTFNRSMENIEANIEELLANVKNPEYDPNVEQFQMIYNELNPESRLTIDGLFGRNTHEAFNELITSQNAADNDEEWLDQGLGDNDLELNLRFGEPGVPFFSKDSAYTSWNREGDFRATINKGGNPLGIDNRDSLQKVAEQDDVTLLNLYDDFAEKHRMIFPNDPVIEYGDWLQKYGRFVKEEYNYFLEQVFG